MAFKQLGGKNEGKDWFSFLSFLFRLQKSF
jgi:hypothetical protein